MCGEYFQEGHGSGPPSPSGCQNFQGPGASFCFHQVHYESEANATHTDTDTHLNGDKRQPAGHLLPRVPMLRGRRRGHDALTQSGIWKAELISDDQRTNDSFQLFSDSKSDILGADEHIQDGNSFLEQAGSNQTAHVQKSSPRSRKSVGRRLNTY